MKNLLSKVLLIVTLIVVSCDKEETSLELDSASFNDKILEIKALGFESDKVVEFEIYTDGENYGTGNVVLVDQFVSKFNSGYNNETVENISQNRSSGVSVSCSNGKVTNCSGSNEGACVGSAVKRCLDGRGCAEVCTLPACFYPAEDLIIVGDSSQSLGL